MQGVVSTSCLNDMNRKNIFVVLFILSIVATVIGCTKTENTFQIIALPDSSGISIFDLLRMNHEVEYDSTSSGVFVKSIDGTPNTRSAYWLFFVNDTAATTASDKYVLHGGEKVEWRYISGY